LKTKTAGGLTGFQLISGAKFAPWLSVPLPNGRGSEQSLALAELRHEIAC
jgi:hypothetical protein